MTIDDLALTLHPELGCRTAIHLLECFGSAEAVFRRHLPANWSGGPS